MTVGVQRKWREVVVGEGWWLAVAVHCYGLGLGVGGQSSGHAFLDHTWANWIGTILYQVCA